MATAVRAWMEVAVVDGAVDVPIQVRAGLLGGVVLAVLHPEYARWVYALLEDEPADARLLELMTTKAAEIVEAAPASAVTA